MPGNKGSGGAIPRALNDLVFSDLDPSVRIRTRIYKSRVFARILGYIIIKAVPISPTEASRELEMDTWMVNKTLLQMTEMGLLQRTKREGIKQVFYCPNGSTKEFKTDVMEALQGRKA